MQRTAPAAYDSDFTLWAEEQAAALREGRFADLDMPHLLEEIDDLSNRKRDALLSRLIKIELHLLKLKYQPEPLRGHGAARSVSKRGKSVGCSRVRRRCAVKCHNSARKHILTRENRLRMRPGSRSRPSPRPRRPISSVRYRPRWWAKTSGFSLEISDRCRRRGGSNTTTLKRTWAQGAHIWTERIPKRTATAAPSSIVCEHV